MRIDELKKRQKILAQYGKGLTARYENYKEGSIVLAVFSFIAAAIALLFGTSEKYYVFIGIGISFIFTGVTFILITGLFKLMGQIKEISTIILLKMGDHIENEKSQGSDAQKP